jgi:uncharacterized SAM-binding protein YcdF (DUF218 family)
MLWLLIEPLNLVALLVIAAAIAAWRGKARGARTLVTFAALGFIVAVASPLDQALLIPLEGRFQYPDPLPDKVDGIILLGGAERAVLTSYFKQPELNGTAETLTTFLALARNYPNAKLVFSGGSGDLLRQDVSEVETVRMFLRQQRFDENKVLYEGKSRNTYENAVFSKALVQPHSGETWLMIVSARSAPRAMGVFRKAGWEVIVVPCDHRAIPELDWQPAWNVGGAFQDISEGLHEWLGLLAYYVTGKTNELFPGP